MMAANISELGNLQPIEPLDMDSYEANKEGGSFQLPVKSRYVVRAPESFPETAFSATQEGFLSVQVDPTLVGPTNEGFQLRFIRVSAKTFRRGAGLASYLGDYLKACGVTGRFNSVQELADAVASTAGMTYEVELDWRAYNAKTKFSVKGMENFPLGTDGQHQTWVIDPNDTTVDAVTGEERPKRVLANLIVTRFIPRG